MTAPFFDFLWQRLLRRPGLRPGHISKISALTAVTCLVLSSLCAAVPVPVAPETARLSPSGGLLEVRQQVPVITSKGVSRLYVALPAGAENFQISVPGQTVARWNGRPLTLDNDGTAPSVRTDALREIRQVQSLLETVDTRIGLLSEQPSHSSFQDMVQQDARLAEALPALRVEKAELAHRLSRLQETLKRLPPEPGIGTLMEVTLLKPMTDASVEVRYSYTLEACGWQPRYVFDAHPDTDGTGDHVSVRFLAEMWQHSGMAWEKTHLTLVSGSGGPREPGRLPQWIVESREPTRAMMRESRMLEAAAPVEAGRAPQNTAEKAVIRTDVSSVYASWILAAQGLPEGRSRMLVLEDSWKVPFQWIARPSRGDSRVWIHAHCLLPKERVWPSGMAEFLMDGQSVGSGRFTPKGGEADMAFGVDPRVQVQATEDARKRGEEGFINKNRTWSWAWTYTVRNARDRALTVRLERPMPQLVDKAIAVTYGDTPDAQRDEKAHKLFWDVQVPAHGQAAVRHAVTITAPKDMPLTPVAP